MERLIGQYAQALVNPTQVTTNDSNDDGFPQPSLSPGPLLIATTALHGNERAGVPAIQTVLKYLNENRPPFRGTFMGLMGNLAAYEANQRFMVRDLNRKWSDADIKAILSHPQTYTAPEDIEQRALLDWIHRLHAQRQGQSPMVFMDLHSTSAQSVPFCGIADTLINRPFALALPIPTVLGLEETIDGSMLGYLSDLGHVTVAVEGGQHEDPATVENLIACLWIGLVTAGCIAARDVPDYNAHVKRLKALCHSLPRIVEIRYRHVVTANDQFEMNPGFVNFQSIGARQWLAQDRQGPINALESGLILMPLYQSQGEDGFFVVKRVHPFWLWLSAWLRKLGAQHVLPYLPGIRRHPTLHDHFIADETVTRFFLVELLHLFGYRKRQQLNQQLIFSRRQADFSPRAPLG